MNSNCKYTSYCSCSSISSNIFHRIVNRNIGEVSFEANCVQDRKIVIWSGCKCYRFPILPSVPHFPHQIFSVTRHPIPMFLVYLKRTFFANDFFLDFWPKHAICPLTKEGELESMQSYLKVNVLLSLWWWNTSRALKMIWNYFT